MTEAFSDLTSTKYPLQLLLFPVLTNLSQSNKCKSHQSAELSGRPEYVIVLNTRTRGFLHGMQ